MWIIIRWMFSEETLILFWREERGEAVREQEVRSTREEEGWTEGREGREGGKEGEL